MKREIESEKLKEANEILVKQRHKLADENIEYKSALTESKLREERLEESNKWLKKFIWEDAVNLKIENAIPPFRVGKKQKRAILDSTGHEIGIFYTGQEKIAQIFCDFLNINYDLLSSNQAEKGEG